MWCGGTPNLYLKPRNTGLVSSRIHPVLYDEGVSLALVGNPARDGVSIKILLFRPRPQNLTFVYKWILPTNDVKINNISKSQLKGQGANAKRLHVIMQILSTL